MKDALVEKINTILQSDSLKNIYSNYFKEKLHNKVVKICVDDIKPVSNTHLTLPTKA